MLRRSTKPIDSSWEKTTKEYDCLVSNQGHYYHRTIILPSVIRLLSFPKKTPTGINPRILDLGCGQGVLARSIPQNISYLGIDISPSLIKSARSRTKGNTLHRFAIKNLALPFDSSVSNKEKFSHAAAILSLQNIENPLNAIQYASSFLEEKGIFVLVLNHPCFRIPRLSSWGADEKQRSIYRRIDRYMSPTTIPIIMNPGSSDKSVNTLSFHFPLSYWTKALVEAGFVIEVIEEWNSDKSSVGTKAKAENRARKEFPLFLAIKAAKITVIR